MGRIELSCPLGIRALSRKEYLSCVGVLSHLINPLLTKLVRSIWLDIGLARFFQVYVRLGHKHAKKRTWPIFSHLDLTLDILYIHFVLIRSGAILMTCSCEERKC